MSDHRHHAGHARHQRVRGCLHHTKRDCRPLAAIKQQRQQGQPFAAGAKHIRRADIAAADGADVTLAGQACENQTERH